MDIKRVMKKIVIAAIILVSLLLAVEVFLRYGSSRIPPVVRKWNTRLEQTQPEPLTQLSQERRQLLVEMDEFIYKTTAVEGSRLYHALIKTSFSESAKLLRLRLQGLAEEINQTQVPEDKIKIWHVYNMGVVVKASDITIGFDLAGRVFARRFPSRLGRSQEISRIANLCDILTASHEHGDHFDPPLLAEAVENGVTVVLPHGPEAGGRPAEKIKDRVSKNEDKIIDLPMEETVEVKGVKITAYEADHRHEPSPDNSWFVVELGGVRLAHTGDGMLTQPDWHKVQPIDIFLMNEQLGPQTAYDSQAEIVIPLHLHMLGHRWHTITMQREQHSVFINRVEKEGISLKNGQIVPLLWGENITLNKNELIN